MHIIHHFQQAKHEYNRLLFCIRVCVGMCASKGMHSLKFSLFGISDSQTLTHFPSIHRLDLFLPHGGPTSTLSQQKRWEQEECVFSSRLALHEYFKQAT